MIICAAIKYEIRIDKQTKREVILCGRRHGEIMAQLIAFGLTPADKGVRYFELCQGFISHRGEFLDRKQAYVHAVDCGQVGKQYVLDYGEQETLFSEDLW